MPYKTVSLIFALSITLVLAGCGGGTDSHPGQPVKNRQAAFKKMLQAKDELGLVVRGRKEFKAQAFLDEARELQRLSSEPWQYFTPGSNYSPTRAKPEVWDDPAKFISARHGLDGSLAQLVKAAETADMKAINAAFADVETDCMSCHKRFRNTIPTQTRLLE
jgi:cytochrome c556